MTDNSNFIAIFALIITMMTKIYGKEENSIQSRL